MSGSYILEEKHYRENLSRKCDLCPAKPAEQNRLDVENTFAPQTVKMHVYLTNWSFTFTDFRFRK